MRINPFLSLLPFLRALPFRQLTDRRYKQYLASTDPAPHRLGAAQWVLSRPLYRFRRFDLINVPKAQRIPALRLQVRQWSPYLRSGQCVVWGADHALVWAWDADRLDAEFAAQKLKSKAAHVIPESLLHPPLSSGLRLVACLDGVEGEFWQEQRLVHSRWWPKLPSAMDWLNFQRDAGIAADQGDADTLRVPEALPWLKQPWAKTVDLSRDERLVLPYESWLMGGTVLLLAGLTSGYAIDLIKARQAAAQARVVLEEATQKARPILDARRRALDALTRIETLRATHPYPAQLALLAEVAKQMPKDSLYLKEWDYQNGKLKFTVVSSGQLSSSFVVKKVQDIAWFKNVQAIPGTDPTTLTLTMEVLPNSETALLAHKTEGSGDVGKLEKSGAIAPPLPKI